jgi:hypothetical protein
MMARESHNNISGEQGENNEHLDRVFVSIAAAHLACSSLGSGRHFIFHNPAVEKMDGTIRVLCKTLVMRHHADRGPTGVKLFQEIHDGFAVAGVEVAGRFVGKQDGRFPGKGARHGDTLLLATGKLAGEMFGAMRHANALERFIDESFPLARSHSAIGQR